MIAKGLLLQRVLKPSRSWSATARLGFRVRGGGFQASPFGGVRLAVRWLAIYRGSTWGFPVLFATEGTMATGFNVRVGDADREAIAAQLREHYADGRLTLDELNERLDQTFAAKTKADLDVVMRDLPHVARPFTDAPASGLGNTAWQGQAWPGPTGQSSWDYGSGNGRRY